MTTVRYGIDAPGIMAGLLAAGAGLLVGAATLHLTADGAVWAAVTAAALLVAGVATLGLGITMAAYATVGKMRIRDRMLADVSWTGREQVLDIGTGAGLLLIGAAKRLTEGRALGIDVWSAKDLSNNSAATACRNIALEGVQDRARVETADARALPLPDATIDCVLSLLCLHNIEGAAAQAQACREIARVLKPGGLVLIGDYVPTKSYALALCAAGLQIVRSQTCFRTALGPLWLLRAEKRSHPVGVD